MCCFWPKNVEWALLQISCAASAPDCRNLFCGGTSGMITVFKIKLNESKVSSVNQVIFVSAKFRDITLS